MISNCNTQFRSAIIARGLMPPEVIVPGKLHRFPGIGKKKGNTSGWCTLFIDEFGGSFGDWSKGFSENWHANRHKHYTPVESRALRHRIQMAKRQAEIEQRLRQKNAAKRANKIWQKALPVTPNHPYLIRKCIHPYGARMHKGSLTLPITDFSGNLTSLQFIDATGHKLLLSGGRKQGCFISVSGHISQPSRVIICEGWATACTLAEDNCNGEVIAAVDAGNLKPVALNARYRWPKAELIIAGDDDRLTDGNPGATKAKLAAAASGASIALPIWPENSPNELTDFNDLAVWLLRGGL